MGDGLRPLIAVTTSEMRSARDVRPTDQADPPQVEMALGLSYMHAVEAAGGLPLVIPPMHLEAVEPLLTQVAGVCLSGGPDLDPVTYGAEPHPYLGPVNEALDLFEIEVARQADARGLPVLAICRGMQALNVARGGTLHQHLPERPGATTTHRQSEPGTQPTHGVRIAPESRLAGLMGAEEAEVNSFHHQAIDKLGSGLRAVAWCEDGVIEAVEAPARDFLMGVQWHAETLTDRPEQSALFDALVQAASRSGARSPRIESAA